MLTGLLSRDKEVRDLIIPEFFGHVRHMMRHAEASWLLDDIYRGVASPKQKDRLLREWYGGDFAVLANTDPVDETSKLANILARTPEKRLPIMRALYEFINRMVQKRTTGFTMLHDAMWEYFSNVKRGSDEMTEFLEMLKGDEEGDLLKNLAFTPSGSRVVCLALALGTAKVGESPAHSKITRQETDSLVGALGPEASHAAIQGHHPASRLRC